MALTTRKYGRTVNGFDTTTPSPLAAAATAAYAKTPSALLPASAFNVLGRFDLRQPRQHRGLPEHLAPVQPARQPGMVAGEYFTARP